MTPRTPAPRQGDTADESTRTVFVALGAGLGVALCKAGAAIVTGSSALAAEASHSLADTANELLLLVAQRRSTRPANARHPLGYGREAYFWALIAACAAFVAGAAFSLRDGINELIHPSVTSSFLVAYAALGLSTVFDLVSFRRSAGQLVGQGRRHHRSLLEESRLTSDPTLRAVFVEDTVSVAGDVLALVAVALNQLTGSSTPQAVVAMVIGLLLIRVSLRLVRRSHDFLVGVWVLIPPPEHGEPEELTQTIGPDETERVQAFLASFPGVTGVREILVNFIGPGRVWVVARVEIDASLNGAQIAALAHGIETGMRRESASIHRVDIIPVDDSSACGRAQPPLRLPSRR